MSKRLIDALQVLPAVLHLAMCLEEEADAENESVLVRSNLLEQLHDAAEVRLAVAVRLTTRDGSSRLEHGLRGVIAKRLSEDIRAVEAIEDEAGVTKVGDARVARIEYSDLEGMSE